MTIKFTIFIDILRHQLRPKLQYQYQLSLKSTFPYTKKQLYLIVGKHAENKALIIFISAVICQFEPMQDH